MVKGLEFWENPDPLWLLLHLGFSWWPQGAAGWGCHAFEKSVKAHRLVRRQAS